MKILHTSDWHLGHVLYGYSQEEEQQCMLGQLAEIVRQEKPDAFLIAGDVYDTTQPSATVQRMFADAIVNIHQACPDMPIICIAGNHDSGSKHMIFQTPWQALGVHMIGSIVRDSPLDDYIIKVKDKGYIVAVPFAADRFMPDDVFRHLLEIVAEQNAVQQLPVFVMGHLALMNSDFRGHELSTDDYIGGLDCKNPDVFGQDFDYVALGHIHKAQTLGENANIRYCGTPVAVSFDEIYKGNSHGVSIVECGSHGGGVKIETIEIKNQHPLVNIPAEGYESWENVIKELKEYPEDISSYIRLNVEVEQCLKAGAMDEARSIADTKQCRVCLINSKRAEKKAAVASVSLTREGFKRLDQAEVLGLYVKSKGQEFDDELMNLFHAVKQSLQEFPDSYPDSTNLEND